MGGILVLDSDDEDTPRLSNPPRGRDPGQRCSRDGGGSGGTQGGDDDDDGGSPLPGIILVVVDVLAQALLYSSTGAAYGAVVGVDVCVAFGAQVGRSKLLSFGASVSLGLAAVVKDVSLPFNVWPG